MVSAWFDAEEHRQTIALIASTHAEALAISEDIQDRRIRAGGISTAASTSGQHGQPIFVGDIVQTRRNDRQADVQNRQHWVVVRITEKHVVLASTSDSTNLKSVAHEYANAHMHLGYASTVYGVQGETTDRALVGPGVDAAGLYVGLTRGKDDNEVVLVAPTKASARTQLVEMMQRRSIEETLDASRVAARIELNRAAKGETGPSVGAHLDRTATLGVGGHDVAYAGPQS
jgi:ATP-dependent exoDNAse (exonuclease V) alpha subunit